MSLQFSDHLSYTTKWIEPNILFLIIPKLNSLIYFISLDLELFKKKKHTLVYN